MRRVLVTGGTGFIGGYTCRELEARGYEPVVLDRLRGRGRWNAPPWDVTLGDVRNREGIEAIVGTVDGVIHLAGQLGTQETVRHPHTAAETNVMGTLNVLAACHAYDVPLVNISVGNWWMNNSYSITKNCAERLCLMFRKEHGAKVSVVRALNAYGPGQKAEPVQKIIPTFINQALAGEPIRVYGDGEQIMDMIHVRDVAAVLVRALEQLPDKVVQAGTGRRTTVNQIAVLVLNAVAAATGCVFERGAIEHTPMRPGEEEHSVVIADTRTLVGGLGIDPSEFTTLEDGLAETVAYYRDAKVKVMA